MNNKWKYEAFQVNYSKHKLKGMANGSRQARNLKPTDKTTLVA